MKNISLPSFIKNVDYKEYSTKDKTGKYRFVTLVPVTIYIKNRPLLPTNFKLQFIDSSGKKWMTIARFSITISEGYAWDGCTPKRNLFNRWIGTPDFPETIIASLFHDALRQFELTEHFPFSREIQDNIFFSILKEQNFKFSSLYLLGANIGSVIFPKRKSSGLSSLKISVID